MAVKSKPNELLITRLYDAPVAAVWDAWTDPAQTAQWWGPRGFTLTTHSKDLRVGGHWHYTMHGPDGTDYPNHTVYHEVEPYKRLVYDHGGYGDRPPLFRVTVTFEQKGEQTEMVMIMALPTKEAAEQTRTFIKGAGGNGTWDRLAEYLAEAKGHPEIFVMNRSFKATAAELYDRWTKPRHFAEWLGPVGARLEYLQDEIAEGKTAFYKMVYDADKAMHGQMHYRKLSPPTYLEYTQIFCDKDGQLTKHPHVPVWPDTLLTRVFIVPEEAEGTTRVTLIWEPFGKVTAEERKAFAAMKSGMAQGWTEAFDKLEAYLPV